MKNQKRGLSAWIVIAVAMVPVLIEFLTVLVACIEKTRDILRTNGQAGAVTPPSSAAPSSAPTLIRNDVSEFTPSDQV